MGVEPSKTPVIGPDDHAAVAPTGEPPTIAPGTGTLPQAPSATPPEAVTHAAGPEVRESGRLRSVAPAVHVPGYEILGELGRGGMGVVYKARQVKLNRVVALKMILSSAHAGPDDLERFRVEAEAVARLQHPHIVQIHEVGEHEGRPFFSLEFCPGGALDKKLGGTPLPPAEAARLVETLARAMHAAHQRQVIHRDLKPANVLLAADGEPKVTDFGLAKKLDDVGRTQSGAIMGTPSYMAPEQAGGKAKEVGPAADIYALGAILYECLTGRPPFKAATALETVLQVLDRDPVPPRLVNPHAPRELEAICLKCLEKDPRRRYASAADLAEDLGRFLRGESISVRSVNVLDRLARTLERTHLDADLHAWGGVLLAWAAVVLLAHAVITMVMLAGLGCWIWCCYAAQFLGMGLAYAALRPRRGRPAGAPEQQLWSLWGGYIFACLLLLLVRAELPGFDWAGLVANYPFAALLTGLAFTVVGAGYWGRGYAFAAGFFALAVLMPLGLVWAPAEFGLLWAAALAAIGWRLRGENAPPPPGFSLPQPFRRRRLNSRSGPWGETVLPVLDRPEWSTTVLSFFRPGYVRMI